MGIVFRFFFFAIRSVFLSRYQEIEKIIFRKPIAATMVRSVKIISCFCFCSCCVFNFVRDYLDSYQSMGFDVHEFDSQFDSQ